MEDPINEFEYISVYTRAQALADGVLVDVTAEAHETGLKVASAITSHLHQILEDIPAQSRGQDYRGRLHDVLWMTYLKLRAMKVKGFELKDFPTEVSVIIDGEKRELWVVLDGDGLTVMLPDDY